MRQLKVFYSCLSEWARGNKDRAIQMMMGKEIEPTEYELYGRKIHKKITKKKWRPFNWMDNSYEYEVKLEAVVFPWLKVTGKIDSISKKYGVIIDWKSGIYSSSNFKPMQLYVYDLLAFLGLKVSCKKGYIVKVLYQRGLMMEDYSRYKLGQIQRRKALDWIESVGSEMYAELIGTK